MEKVLGKISKVHFGKGGYQESQWGLHLCFDMDGSGVCTSVNGGWAFAPSDYAKWTLESQTREYAEMNRKVISIMEDAGVDDVMKLLNVPVEVTIDGNSFHSFRILKEVL